MKNFKKIALGLAVMLIAFGFSAFKTIELKNERNSQYFKFTGSPGTENDKLNWEHVTGIDIPTCDNTNGGCVIEVLNDELYLEQTSPGVYVLIQDIPLVPFTFNPQEGSMVLESYNREN